MKAQAQVNKLRRGVVLLPAAGAAWLLATRSRRAFDVPEVDVGRAKELFDAGTRIIDVRKMDRFDYRHIVGALPVPLAVLQAAIPIALASAKEAAILVYCGDGLSIGPEGTHILRSAGYSGAVNLKGGIEGWAAAGLPITRQAS